MNVFDQSTNLFRIIMREKNQLDGWIKFTKIKEKCTCGVQCIKAKQPLSKVHVSACCRCLLPS